MAWNGLFHALELSVPRFGTVCSTLWNCLFHALELSVPRFGTACSTLWNCLDTYENVILIQYTGLLEQSCSHKVLTAGGSYT